MTVTNETKKTPHSKELLSSFFSFVFAARTREDTRGTPSAEGETATRERGKPLHHPTTTTATATATTTTTTTVTFQLGRLGRPNLPVWKMGAWEVFV